MQSVGSKRLVELEDTSVDRGTCICMWPLTRAVHMMMVVVRDQGDQQGLTCVHQNNSDIREYASHTELASMCYDLHIYFLWTK